MQNTTSQVANLPALENRVVCLDYSKNDGLSYIGSGFILQRKKDLYLVTATHNCTNVLFNTLQLLFQDSGKIKTLPLMFFTTDTSFKSSNKYDLSVLKLTTSNPNVINLLKRFSFQWEETLIKKKGIQKGLAVTGMGFIDKTGDIFNPQLVKNVLHTSVIDTVKLFPRADTRTPSNFFILEADAAKGMSGGPVFTKVMDKKQKLIGIFHGSFPDSTGKRHASVTPLSELRDLLY